MFIILVWTKWVNPNGQRFGPYIVTVPQDKDLQIVE